MKLKSRALVSKENEKKLEEIDTIGKDNGPKRLRRPKRIIEDDSSSSSDSDSEDNVPLNKRKVNQNVIPEKVVPTKKLKLTNHDQFDSPRKVFDLGQRSKYRHVDLQKDLFSSSLSKQSKEANNVIKNFPNDTHKLEQNQKKYTAKSMPPPIRSNVFKEPNVQQARSSPQSPNMIKAQVSPNGLKPSVPSNNFNKPLQNATPNSEFKAPLPINASPNAFNAPPPPKPSSEFKAPMGPPAFASPRMPEFTEKQQSECKYICVDI